METGAAAPICPFCGRFRYTIPMRVCVRTSKFLILLSILCQTFVLSAFADEGTLDSAKPTGITAEEIIQRFAAKEKEFKDARDQYTFRQSVTVQTVDGDTVTGEYREVFDVQFDDRGKHLENVVFAPQSSLENGGISMSPEDIDDIRHKLPFVLTSEDVGEYDVLYVGQQQEDELHCYVFDIAPKQIQGKKRYFQGRIWVDDKDYQIVKTFGKTVPETRVKKNGKGNENLFPKFTTWREQIDGKYWFPTYTKADDILHFHTGDIHIREIVKYTDYKRFGSNVKITYEGKEVQKDQNGQEKPADSKPAEKPQK
jgi:outer membrane lipoprotein-sorting protein